MMNGGGLGLGGPADGRGKMKSFYDMGTSYFQQCEQWSINAFLKYDSAIDCINVQTFYKYVTKC